jgi:magnesium transporter
MEDWSALSLEEKLTVLRQLPPARANDLFLNMSPLEQAQLLLEIPQQESRDRIRLLAPDDATDVIQQAPEEARPRLLGLLTEAGRREVSALLAYEEDEAGGLMSPRFARLRPDITVDEAITYLRNQVSNVETVHYAYVLDANQRLLGIITLRRLLSAKRQQLVRDIMRTNFLAAPEDMDQEALAQIFAEEHLLAMPVVDSSGRMKGIVTVDDIVDVVEEEASEDIQKIGGVTALDAPYLQIGLPGMLKKRGGWLSALFLGEMLTATAMAYYEDEIARAVVLALFIPLIISSGGNSGSQASTLVIRAMALGEIRVKDWWRVVRREFAAGLGLGVLLGGIGMLRIVLWHAVADTYGEHYVLLAWTIGVSLVGVVLFGTLAGSTLPFILRRLGFDPASASAPFVATLVDVSGLVIYFTVASIILGTSLPAS